MGKIAADLSDVTIVTSDNPRTENPGAIMGQIRAGISPLGITEFVAEDLAEMCRGNNPAILEKGFVMLENRREAIRLAVGLARPGDVVLLAGKGHEDYQIIGALRQHFDDREEAGLALAERGS
jgi:UDP-N-acetylmuramoyl-L-alanyl-D-glutamate--2,6-diaminopimelate ligase